MVEYLLRNHNYLLGIQHALLGMQNITSDRLATRILAIRYQKANVLDEIAQLIGIYFKEDLKKYSKVLLL